MLLGLSAALLAAVLFGVLAVVQAAAIRRHSLVSWPILGVVGGYVVGWLLHLVAIAELPLYLAQVSVSSSLVITALIASSVMGEPLHTHQWAAVVAMVAGLALLAISAGPLGTSSFSSRTTVAIYALLVANAVAGWLVWRWRGDWSGVLLGVLSGAAYAGSPVASRALVDFSWDVDTLATALSIGMFGALGFVLYSVALRRTSVTAATAPSVLLQTAIPAVVGLFLFEDQVRQGWWPAALAAFLVSIAAGIVLCGAESRLDLLEVDEVAQPS